MSNPNRFPPPPRRDYHGVRAPPAPSSRAPPPHRRVLRYQKVADKDLQSRLIYQHICAVSDRDFPPKQDRTDHYILLRAGSPQREYVVTGRPVPGFEMGGIALSDPQRTWCTITKTDEFTGEIYDPFVQGPQVYLGNLDVEVSFASPNKKTTNPFDVEAMSAAFSQIFENIMLAPSQRVLFDFANIPLMVVVKSITLVSLDGAASDRDGRISTDPSSRGILVFSTKINFTTNHQTGLTLEGGPDAAQENSILSPHFSFENMGIGGLDSEFSTIFRRAFASRVHGPKVMAALGIKPIKGMLLYGPPGTGKTLIARQIGAALKARPPKIVNGPEVLNKYVGQSEENIRKLFGDAEKEWKEKGEDSALHIIIFDELDAVCKQRGSGAGGGTGVGDSVVNQLLTKLDGVDQFDNFLLIGMTNRMDMIDTALLRPGRLEVHVEISLPDEAGRREIFDIHTATMRKNGMLGADVDINELASLTRNYSGAEISGVVKSAASFAMGRQTELGEDIKPSKMAAEIKVNHQDFINALQEVRSALGVSETGLKSAASHGICEYAGYIPELNHKIRYLMDFIKENGQFFVDTALLHGPPMSGKTALAASNALSSGFPFVKLIAPADLIGFDSEHAKKAFLHSAFTDAYKSSLSLLILDDIERLVGWNPIGPVYSSTMVNALIDLLRASPPKNHRLLVLATTSSLEVLNRLGISSAFLKKFPVRNVANLRELERVLLDSPFVTKEQAETVIQRVFQGNGENDKVNIGIKKVLRYAAEATEGKLDVVDSLTDLLLGETLEPTY